MTLPLTLKNSITKHAYETTSDGKAVDEYTLTNANSVEVKIITYGGVITSVRVPNRHGTPGNVVLSCVTLTDYETKSAYLA